MKIGRSTGLKYAHAFENLSTESTESGVLESFLSVGRSTVGGSTTWDEKCSWATSRTEPSWWRNCSWPRRRLSAVFSWTARSRASSARRRFAGAFRRAPRSSSARRPWPPPTGAAGGPSALPPRWRSPLWRRNRSLFSTTRYIKTKTKNVQTQTINTLLKLSSTRW